MTQQVTEQATEAQTGEAPQDAQGAPVEAAQGGGEQSRQSALRKAYGAATTRLREAHRDEFDSLYSQEAEALGVEYKPRPTAEQRAEQQMKELLSAYPHLASKVAPVAQ